MEIAEWKANLERARESKDAFYAQHWQSAIPPQDRPWFKGLKFYPRESPIPPQDRPWFKSLEYYPPDPSYRFELDLHEYPEKRVVRIAYTKGNEQDFFHWGEFRFKIGGKEQTLQAYKSRQHKELLFIPFRDATSGKETYGAGRYLHLVPDSDYTSAGKWILDFNEAENPWCAYSEDYTCPFVPIENWLNIPIQAGEKNYPLIIRREKLLKR